jgi:D-specific alpha-keto acid dehydrogenase
MTELGISVYGCDEHEAALFRELAPHFGVTPTITSAVVSAATVISVPANRCVSVGHKAELSASMLRALRRAGAAHVSTRSIGVDHIDLDAAAALGIEVDNAAYAPDGVADFTLMLILMAIRHAPDIVARAARHDFRVGPVPGRDLCDLTVGVVGVGNIGRAVVERLRGFGCRVLAHSLRPTVVPGARFVTFDELLRASDVVTLHVPLTPHTHHLIGREQLGAMRAGAVLVNTGRGALVDTDALLDALEAGQVGGAALDVLEGEGGIFYRDCRADPIDHPALLRLQRLPNAIVTPHTAYYTHRVLRDVVETTLVHAVHFDRRRTHGATEDRDPLRRLFGGA